MDDRRNHPLNSKVVTTLLGAGLIALGILSLVGRSIGALFHFDIAHYGWPLFIIVPGVLLFMASFVLERRAGMAIAILGGMVSMVGCILFIQNLFDVYGSWAYAWALVAPTSVGLAKLAYGALRGLGEEVRSGLRLSGIGLAMFVIGGFFFELVIGINGLHFALGWLCWPALVIGLGVVLVLSNLLPKRNPPAA
jgi:hypothetical protein